MKPARVITLPNGRAVTLAAYVKAWQKLRTLPPETLVSGFDHFPERADVILREISRGAEQRIARYIPGFGVGRKWSEDWQREAEQTARAVNTPRLAVHWLPRDLRKRLAHRVSEREGIAA